MVENKKITTKKQRRYTQEESNAIDSIKSFIINIVVTVVIIAVCFIFVFGIGFQSGEGMYPRVRDGDLILYYRLNKDYIINDVLSFEVNDTRYIARYVAMAGDEIDITDEGQLIINGSIQQEEIFYPTFKIGENIEYPYIVPEDSLFVLGDFRTNAVDSRTFGAVLLDQIDGKVITILRRRGI